jgi:hypothetical protein
VSPSIRKLDSSVLSVFQKVIVWPAAPIGSRRSQSVDQQVDQLAGLGIGPVSRLDAPEEAEDERPAIRETTAAGAKA